MVLKNEENLQPSPLLVVAAALVRGDGAVLLQKRPEGTAHTGLWEFPGGKIDPGETPEGALVRELEEELGILVAPAACRPISFSTGKVGMRDLILLLFACDAWAGTPQCLQAAEIGWFKTNDMSDLAMPPADIPLIAALARWLQAVSGDQPVR